MAIADDIKTILTDALKIPAEAAEKLAGSLVSAAKAKASDVFNAIMKAMPSGDWRTVAKVAGDIFNLLKQRSAKAS